MTYKNIDDLQPETDCSGCPHSGCPAQRMPVTGGLSGWPFVLASLGLFLGPVVLAIAGAACFGSSGETQLFGAILGLGTGILGSLAVKALLRRNTEMIHDDNHQSGG